VFVGLKTGDSDVYLFGPSAVEYENKLRIKRNAELLVAAAKKMISCGLCPLNPFEGNGGSGSPGPASTRRAAAVARR
jgi:hypothetical protein